jgi:hypothetical protein
METAEVRCSSLRLLLAAHAPRKAAMWSSMRVALGTCTALGWAEHTASKLSTLIERSWPHKAGCSERAWMSMSDTAAQAQGRGRGRTEVVQARCVAPLVQSVRVPLRVPLCRMSGVTQTCIRIPLVRPFACELTSK